MMEHDKVYEARQKENLGELRSEIRQGRFQRPKVNTQNLNNVACRQGSKHPLVQQLLQKMGPSSPYWIQSDLEQNCKGDLKQLRRQKYEIKTPQKKIDFNYFQTPQSHQESTGFYEQKTSETLLISDQTSTLSENKKQPSTTAQEILFIQSKNNTSCIPSNQSHVDFKKVGESSLIQKRKAALLKKLNNQPGESYQNA